MLGASDADDVVLDVDAERGPCCASSAVSPASPTSCARSVRSRSARTFPDSTFERELPEGETARPLERPFEHHVTLERAVALAPFVLWIAPRVPSDWEVDITFVNAMERPPTEPRCSSTTRPRTASRSHDLPAGADSGFVDELPGGGWEQHRVQRP